VKSDRSAEVHSVAFVNHAGDRNRTLEPRPLVGVQSTDGENFLDTF